MKLPHLTLSATLLAPVAGLCAADLSRERPNIIFIFSDDHAQAAISSYGSVVNQTPNIDRIAAAGARFKNTSIRPASPTIPSSSTPPTTAGIWASSASTTSASCMSPACASRSSPAVPA